MLVYKMAAVGDNGSLEGEDDPKNGEDGLVNLCKKNGIHHTCFLGESYRDSVESRIMKYEKLSKLNGASKTHSLQSAPFTKPSIPSLRSRKERVSPEICRRKRRSSKHESPEQRDRSPCGRECLATSNNGISNNQNANNNKVPSIYSDNSSECRAVCDQLLSCTPTSSGCQKCEKVLEEKKMKGPLPDILQSCTPDIKNTGPCLLNTAGINKQKISSHTSQTTTANGTNPTFLIPSWLGTHSKATTTSSSGTSSGTPSGTSSGASLPYGISNNKSTPSTSNTVAENGTDTNEVESTVVCRWKNCDMSLKSTDLMNHIRQKHVDTQSKCEKVVCLWAGCKVYDKPSITITWLERHIVFHSGDKPFKCIVDKCNMRFTNRAGLERHVNRHFNTVPAQQKVVKSGDSTPTKLLKKRKLKRRRPAGVKVGDFFDSGIMDMLHQQLQDITDRCSIDITESTHTITFHSTVIAKKTEKCGKVKHLLQWRPLNILPDIWVTESEALELSTKVIPITQLPPDTAVNIHPSSYRKHRFRKHRRK